MSRIVLKSASRRTVAPRSRIRQAVSTIISSLALEEPVRYKKKAVKKAAVKRGIAKKASGRLAVKRAIKK